MGLYHFTTTVGFWQIGREGRIQPGVVATPEGTTERCAISLTSVPDPNWHGLPRGEELTQAQAQALGERAVRDRMKWRCRDHTAYRLQLDIAQTDPSLIRAANFYQQNPGLLLALQFAAVYPPGETISEPQRQRALAKLAAGIVPDRAASWFFYDRAVEVSGSTIVGVRKPGSDQYFEDRLDAVWKRLDAMFQEESARRAQNQQDLPGWHP